MATADTYRRTYRVSWSQLHQDCKALAWKLSALGPFAGIIAITRGGLFPAAVIARELDIRIIDTVSVISYDWQTKGEPRIVKPLAIETDGEGWLLVDDMVDTGGTARFIRSLVPRAHLATVYAKPAGKPLVDTFVTEVSQDTWILQPWDSEAQFVEPIATAKTGK